MSAAVACSHFSILKAGTTSAYTLGEAQQRHREATGTYLWDSLVQDLWTGTLFLSSGMGSASGLKGGLCPGDASGYRPVPLGRAEQRHIPLGQESPGSPQEEIVLWGPIVATQKHKQNEYQF